MASGRSVARACDCAWGMDLSSSHQLTRGMCRLWRECVTSKARATEKTIGEGLDRLVAAPVREGGGLLQMEEHMVDREAHGWVGTHLIERWGGRARRWHLPIRDIAGSGPCRRRRHRRGTCSSNLAPAGTPGSGRALGWTLAPACAPASHRSALQAAAWLSRRPTCAKPSTLVCPVRRRVRQGCPPFASAPPMLPCGCRRGPPAAKVPNRSRRAGRIGWRSCCRRCRMHRHAEAMSAILSLTARLFLQVEYLREARASCPFGPRCSCPSGHLRRLRGLPKRPCRRLHSGEQALWQLWQGVG